MSEHTPGPWRVRIGSTCSGAWPEIVEADGDEDDDALASCETAFILDHSRADAQTVAATYNERPDRFLPYEDADRVMANARLIAAAPDLLDALERLISLDDRCEYREFDEDSTPATCPGIAENGIACHWCYGRAAIAKATGAGTPEAATA